MIRTYSNLVELETLEERYNYLRLQGSVGFDTFGHERWLNQAFYTSRQWKTARRDVIVRDYGCDLGIQGHDIYGYLFVHHMNPIKAEDLVEGDPAVLDPEFLICASLRTHNAIHYGTVESLVKPMVERRPNDTKLW